MNKKYQEYNHYNGSWIIADQCVYSENRGNQHGKPQFRYHDRFFLVMRKQFVVWNPYSKLANQT